MDPVYVHPSLVNLPVHNSRILDAYLGELHDHSLLPDFIDPTCFEEPYSAGQPLRKPGAFAMLPELPTEVPLRPLVNVGKQRLIAK